MAGDAALDVTKLRRVYGRGYFDGLKAGEKNMTPSKIARTENSLTTTAKKVLEVIRTDSHMSIIDIHTELTRSGSRVDRAIVQGCLNSLVDSKVVKLTKDGYCRLTAPMSEPNPAPRRPAPQMQIVKAEPQPAPVKSEDMEPFGRLLSVSANIKRAAAAIEKLSSEVESLRSLSAEIDDIAIDVEGRLEKITKDSGKLRQLQELLRGI